jgi:hypothetical protein
MMRRRKVHRKSREGCVQCKEKHAKVTILTVPFLLLATPRGEPTAELTSAMRSIHDAFNASGPTSCAASRLLP